MATWLDIEKAADHLGIGVRNLYGLAQEGRIPASKIGKSWRFDQDQIDAWVRANRPLDEFFLSQPADIDSNLLLRDAQREAYAAARDFFSRGGKEAVLQLPVGCGKSGLVAILPFGIAAGRVLVIAPNLTIKAELARVLDVSNRQKCFWRKCRVLTPDTMTAGPYLAVLDSENANVHDCDRSHIVLTNVQQLGASADGWLSKFDDDYFDLIVVDEGHHSAAESWQNVLRKFSKAKVIHLTATPFRTDRKEVPGTIVYRYSFKRAMLRGYIKQLQARYIAPEEIYFTYHGDQHHHTLAEVLQLKDEDWFSRGVAASPECNKHIVDASLDRLETLRQSGTRHQLIAVAMSVNHARAIQSLYAERGYEAAVIHSKMTDEEQAGVFQQLQSSLDCIVQVQMLGEGFDHPHLSVAAIFRPFRSLVPYIQFIGRVMRVIVQNDPRHPDNYGYIVTHIGMNVDSLLEDFRKLDREDEQFLLELLGGAEPEPPREVIEGDAQLRFRPEMVVQGEIVSEFFEEDFIDGEDELLLAELKRQTEALGFDAVAVVAAARREKQTRRAVAASEPFTVSPQRRRREAQRRLNDEVKRSAKIVLNRASLQFAGRDLSFQLFPGAVTGPNFAAAMQMVNQALDKALEIEAGQRGGVPLEVLTRGMEMLPDVAEKVARQVLAVKGADKE